jgi:hypothetical protein
VVVVELDAAFAAAFEAVGMVVDEVGVLGSGNMTVLFEADGRSSGKVRVLCRCRSIAVWFSRSRDLSAEFDL